MNRLLPTRLSLLIALLFSFVTHAQRVVSERDIRRQPEGTPPTNNWVGYTRVGTPPSSIVFVEGPGRPPLGCGSVQFSTPLGEHKAFLYNYDHRGTPLSQVDQISYATYRTAKAAGQEYSVAAIHVVIDYNGRAPGGGDTLVFEPAYNMDQQGPVVSNTWQTWNATGEALWWSTQPINGQCAGATMECLRSWDYIVANNPDAIVLAAGINQGSGNPGLVTAVDAFTFDRTTYNFEPVRGGRGSKCGTTGDDDDGDSDDDSGDSDDDADSDDDDGDDGHGNNNSCQSKDRVAVCHNGKQICVTRKEAEQHYKHGDKPGACHTKKLAGPARSLVAELTPENRLIANTPNPFRGRTMIGYHLAADSRVSLRVFDIMGREVATLVDAQRHAGRHTAEFRAEGLKGGVYFYRITAVSGNSVFEQTRSMLLR